MKEKIILLTIPILIIISAFLSLITGQDIVILTLLLILLMIVSLRLLCNPKELILITIIISMFNATLSDFTGILQFLPVYFYFLMGLTLLLKYKQIKLDKKFTFLVVAIFFMGIIPYLYTEFRIIPFFIGAIKKFGFIIILLFTMNLNLDEFNLKKFIINFIPVTLILNMIVAVYQFIIGYRSDGIVGFLGKNMTGIIGYLLMFYISIEFSKEYNNKNRSYKIIIPLIITFIYGAIAEVKILFITSTLITIIYLLMRKNKIKSMIIMVLVGMVCISSYNYFIKIYPNHNFISSDFLNDYLYNQSYGTNTVNRLSFINDLNNTIQDTGYAKLFGTGIGSGNPSKIELLRGSINEEYDNLKYYWFTTSYLYLEQGLIGLIGYIFIQFVILCKVIKYYKRSNNNFSIVMLLSTITNIIFFIYNSGLFDYSIITIYWIIIGIGFNEKNNSNKLKYCLDC